MEKIILGQKLSGKENFKNLFSFQCESVENSGNSSSGSDQEFPGLQIENLKNALERGQVQSSLGVNPDIQVIFNDYMPSFSIELYFSDFK